MKTALEDLLIALAVAGLVAWLFVHAQAHVPFVYQGF